MLKVFEAFSGIGTQRMALRNLGIEHEVVCIAEIDKFAIRSYEAIHGETLNLGDVSKIDPNEVPDHDLFTYSFPCQDISVAGKGKGFKPESGTRSSLLWECEKIIEVKRPRYLLMENVKNLVSKRFMPGFEKWLELLEELGYTNYWEVLNAKDYGIPQNRKRVFCVSILGTHEPYVFPKPIPLEKRLKDVLEDKVDEKFYLDIERTKQLVVNLKEKSNDEIKQIAQYDTPTRKNSNRFRTYDPDGLAPTLGTMGGGGLEPHIPEAVGIDKSYNDPEIIECANCITSREDRGISNRKSEGTAVIEPVIAASRGRNPNNPSDRTPGSPTEQRLEVNKQGTSNTITTVQKDNYVLEPEIIKEFDIPKEVLNDNERQRRVYNTGGISPTILARSDSSKITTSFRIRKLTPKECWRLMGISDEDFEKAQEVNSNTQLYKQAGNAIVVDVLEGIFRKLFLSKSKEKGNKLEEQLEWLDDLLGVGT